MGADLKKVLSANEKKAKTMACDSFCDKQLENDVWIIFSEIRKTPIPYGSSVFFVVGFVGLEPMSPTMLNKVKLYTK